MAQKQIVIEAKLKDFQKRISTKCDDEKVRYLVVIASRQVGKSFVVRLKCIEWLFRQRCDIGYVTLTNRLGRTFFKKVRECIPKELVDNADSTQLTIETKNKSSMSFLSIESIDKVRGLTFDYLIIDECAFAKEITPDGQNVWQNILAPTMDAKGKKCVFISTPWGRRGLFYESVVKGQSAEYPNWDCVKCTIYDDETKTPEWIEEKRSELTDNAFRQEYCCEFVDDGASYFVGYANLFTETNATLQGNVYCGIDFSDTGEDETIVTFEDENSVVKQYLITGGRDAKYKAIAELINVQDNMQRCYAEKNSMGGVMIHEIKKLLKPHLKARVEEFVTSAQSKPEIIKALALDIENGNLHFETKNVDLLSQFGTFVATINPNTKNVRYEAIKGHHDDRVMSLAICHYCKKKNEYGNRVRVSII